MVAIHQSGNYAEARTFLGTTSYVTGVFDATHEDRCSSE